MSAVDRQAAHDHATTGGQAPIRTCIGCRRKSPAAELLRVVASGEDILPDPRRRTGGRGAWVHPRPACVDLAERRRAYGRALRAPGSHRLDTVREYVECLAPPDQRTIPGVI